MHSQYHLRQRLSISFFAIPIDFFQLNKQPSGANAANEREEHCRYKHEADSSEDA
jgi:hypothetical protein